MHKNVFPSWLFILSTQLYNIQWLCIHSQSPWIGLVKRLRPSLEVLHSIPTFPLDVVFCDGSPPGSTSFIWTGTTRFGVVCTQLPRSKIAQPWVMHKLSIRHCDVGGVLDGVFTIRMFLRDKRHPDLVPLFQPRRDVSSIIDSTSTGGTEASACTQTAMKIPSQRRTPCGMLSIYGLFPLQAPRQTFLTPSVFVSSKWVHRRLSLVERLHVFDVPLLLSKSMPSEVQRLLLLQVKTPLKVLASIVDPILWYISQKYESQNAFSSGLSRSNTKMEQSSDQKHTIPEVAVGPGGDSTFAKHEFQKEVSIKKDSVGGDGSKIFHHDVSKATKADDADIPIYIWDNRITRNPFQVAKLEVIRSWCLRWWKRRLTNSFITWLYSKKGPCNNLRRRNVMEWVVWHRKQKRYIWSSSGLNGYTKSTKTIWNIAKVDLEAGCECVVRASNSDWWEWLDGSRPFFWKWNDDYKLQIRDGVLPYLATEPERWVQPQLCEKKTFVQVKAKLKKVWKVRRYLEDGYVKNLTRFFAVPKGDSDIRMVYDSTVAKLNQCLWAPWFAMPTVRNHLRAVGPGSFMADVDIGEMFLNFIIHPTLRPYCGVDLTRYFPEDKLKKEGVLWVRWSRCCMGLKSSPYNCVQGMMHLAELILGDPSDPKNPFRWNHVELNLPGLPNYDPSLPWVFKCRLDGKIACDIFIYVDDLRPTGPTEEDCWEATRRVGSIINSVGVQDASRKRRPPSRNPGAWAGSVISTTDEQVCVEVAQDKWDKTKRHLDWIIEHFNEDPGIPFKALERIRGFLVYTTRTYPAMVPYLKGIHLTLDGWRKNRDDEGWKFIGVDWDADEVEEPSLIDEPEGPPTHVKPVPRLKADLEALAYLTSDSEAPKRIIRSKRVVSVVYGFGDASGKGFGTGVKVEGELFYRFGEWCTEISERSSNFRELYNLVLGIKELANQGKLTGVEMFLFTDNNTAEGAYFRGTSSNRKLFELVLQLRKMEHDHQFNLHVIHISGDRMIASGIDGLSRGDTTEGIMSGVNILSFVPLHLTALDRMDTLAPWIRDWFKAPIEILDPKGWFTNGHLGNSSFVWAPAPCSAEVALEQLCLARHKRTTTAHIFVVPRLLTAYWRKQLGKIADYHILGALKDPNSWEHWMGNCEECGKVCHKGAGLFCGNFGSARGHWRPCQKVWCGRCYTQHPRDQFPIIVPENEDGFKLERPDDDLRFKTGRNGDHFMTQFQCDLCQFRNLMKRDPCTESMEGDEWLLVCIRRAILDSLWSHEPSTVRNNLTECRRALGIGRMFGFQNTFSSMGPFPIEDTWGLKEACILLHRSLDAGKNDTTIQFNTMRKLRSAFSNAFHASKYSSGLVTMAQDARKTVVTDSPTYGVWFQRFMLGCHKRMGEKIKQDMGVSIQVMHKLMEICENAFSACTTTKDKLNTSLLAMYCIASFCGGLRGEEVPMADLGEFIKHSPKGNENELPHIILPLLGRFKGEKGEIHHLVPMAAVTNTGLQPRRWGIRVIEGYKSLNIQSGPVWRNSKGKQGKMADWEGPILDKIKEVQDKYPHLIDPAVNVYDEYGLSRSFRRGSNTHLRNLNLQNVQDIVDDNNRWRKFDRAKGRMPGMGMSDYYTEIRQAMPRLILYSKHQ